VALNAPNMREEAKSWGEARRTTSAAKDIYYREKVVTESRMSLRSLSTPTTQYIMATTEVAVLNGTHTNGHEDYEMENTTAAARFTSGLILPPPELKGTHTCR
jgi:hypothetical protein